MRRDCWENGPDSQEAYLRELDKDVSLLVPGDLQKDPELERSHRRPVYCAVSCNGSIN